MALYEYRCINKNCEEFEIVKDFNISMKEYSEDKLPVCEKCSEKTVRHYSSVGIQTFSDGYKS